ncbi:MAG: proteasome assembly chaperone family protein [Candidatus Marsarchaeota archaeon]|nr:proteasome assembly chaperone family protein [Candidatus Marsarchaeota archaeon]
MRMNETTIIVHKKIKMKKPVLVEGLPGIGLVGKLAVDHLIREKKALKVATLYSPHFPHQVIMRKSGVLRMIRLKFYRIPGPKNDLLLLAGDVQPLTSEAQYEVNGKILDYFSRRGGQWIITLGGYGTGKRAEFPKVFGAATHKKDIEKYSKLGVVFGETRGSIVGAAGLLLGLGRIRHMHGVCLMGETHGGYVDPKSAVGVLEVLGKLVGMKFDTAALVKKAAMGEKFIKKMEARAAAQAGAGEGVKPAGSDELSYIR